LFLEKQPIPKDITAKHEFAIKLAALGIPLRSYEEMFVIENEERFVLVSCFLKTITRGFMHFNVSEIKIILLLLQYSYFFFLHKRSILLLMTLMLWQISV
jgi:hypothetical protein